MNNDIITFHSKFKNMIILADKLIKIDLCYENCEVDVLQASDILGVYIQRRMKYIASHRVSDLKEYRLKTFEIALTKKEYRLRTDLAQLTLHFENGDKEHFFIKWAKDDCLWDNSSLQKVNKTDSYISLTSNCDTQF